MTGGSLFLKGLIVLAFGFCRMDLAWSDSRGCSGAFHEVPPSNVSVVKAVNTNWFVTGRGLYDYKQELTKDFEKSLNELKSENRWIDFGAGKAIAAEQYLTEENIAIAKKANVLAITYKYGRWFPKYRGPKLEIQKGVYFENLTTLPSYRLGSDVLGIFSYTKHLDYYFRLALKHLEIGGELFISSRFYTTSIILKDGQRVSVAKWLARVKGLNVEFSNGQVLKIIKKGEVGSIPALRLKSISDDLPPSRVFEEIP